MKNIALYSSILILFTLCFYLTTKNKNQSYELAKALALVEKQSEQSHMLQGLVFELKPDRKLLKNYLEREYPNDSLEAYSPKIVWRDMEFEFNSSKDLYSISQTANYWTCGTLFGCTSENYYNLPDFMTDSFMRTIAQFVTKFSYLSIFIIYFTLLVILFRSNRDSIHQKKYTLTFLMLLIGVLISQITGYTWWDSMYGSHATFSFFIAGWKEISYRFFISLILSISIFGVSFFIEKSFKQNQLDPNIHK